ncbi:hypothetical protein A1O1_04206 [Capronia coronata CBS 617.96]|uniref:AMP-activated protein kinase glycogen-binding domain-containing protein n=1 Tax=Capronia coronata CBS 617.96 TaxID=1182541 RepID=W9Z9A9_9EURO|nr:uncharacterized protein A1O1_04206 [Capronia coronata CBS 617.96]EXJ91099.1 hypothetical protein A1O1_04206 [Capronia coronata CBS 617.96]
MPPTTLVTFLVRAPASTRSISLYGSWDNFSAPYPMQRDTRTGPEHWSGCHSFSNIICDGDLQSAVVPRAGGLKMGGTYWYYYKLDDDLESHNSAEPSTTSCPLLPGQLVNVLNVPFALSSSSRSRNDSVSSTSSDFRTMDPSEKFMNPRPVPAKPSLPRLNTSPTFPQQPWSSISSPASAGSGRARSASSRGSSVPGSTNALRVMRVTKKPSFHRSSRSTSRGSSRSNGIIGAFRALASPRTTSPGAALDRGRTTTTKHGPAVDITHGTSQRRTTTKSPAMSQTPPEIHGMSVSPSATPRPLALRREFDNELDGAVVALSSFGQHRRQRSTSREPSSLRNSLSLEESPVHPPRSEIATLSQHLETLKEVASAANTPVWPLTALKIGVARPIDDVPMPLDLEKRLPTLPNTPSSAYPPSAADGSPSNRLDVDLEAVESRFSSTTIETSSCADSYSNNEQSRFSDWTCSTTKLSPASDYAASNATDFDPTSPLVEANLDSTLVNAINALKGAGGQDELGHKSDAAGMEDGLPSALSLSSISSMASSTDPSSHVDLDSAKDAELCWSKFQHYSLPTEDVGSGVTLKAASTEDHVAPLAADEQPRPEGVQPRVADSDGSALPHSSGMQQLLDELSYLSGMIQHT